MLSWTFIILLALFAAALFLYIRKLYVVRGIQSMSVPEKLERINQIAAPLGFEYKLTQDIFTSSINAWQRDYGYSSLYDKHAPFFHMVFDCEPIYFNYEGATWLIEFWKGQYGITTGCEIGIYKADHIAAGEDLRHTFFHTVSDEEMPVFSFTLLQRGLPVCRLCQKHWWLACFLPGRYSEPNMLSMKIAIAFPNTLMCQAFVNGLLRAGYQCADIYIQDNSAAFTFNQPHAAKTAPRHARYRAWVQFKNRALLLLYLHATKPFYFPLDRMILLYKCLPLLFRYILKLRRAGKKSRKRKELYE